MSVTRQGTGCTPPKTLNPATGSCELPPDNPANPPQGCSKIGNPINPHTANKYADEADFTAAGSSPLRFVRHYNSSPVYQYQKLFGANGSIHNPVGQHWYHHYYQGLTVTNNETKLTRNDGQTFSYRPPTTGNRWAADANVNFRLDEVKDTAGTRTGWQVATPDDSVETYSPVGDLLTVTDRSGITQTLSYSDASTATSIAPFPGLLISVSDSFGNSLAFTYNNQGQVLTLTAPAHTGTAANVTTYGYDSANGNLKTVTYPGGAGKAYLYGDDPGESANVNFDPATNATRLNPPDPGVGYTHALTGITDEAGVRYATYKYDGSGRAVSTEHADTGTGPTGRHALQYLYDDPNTAAVEPYRTTVTDPLGSVRTTYLTTVLGIVKPTGTDQPGGSGCAAASSNITYDGNGNVAARTDFNGHKVCYGYDTTRNLETARVEGLAAGDDCLTKLSATSFPVGSSIRKVSTEWHPSYRLPTKIAEPLKLTTISYDAAGNVHTRTEQATTDTNGTKGLSPTVSGSARTWTYDYDGLGRMKSEDGPRTDITTDITTYTYYADTDPDLGKRGNLMTISRPLGQVTTYNSYTPSGQPTLVTAANGVKTSLDYTPRGWLKTLTVSDSGGGNSETTSYSYGPTGLLTAVTQPDGSVLNYGYDPAHRLTDLSDRLGNSVHYTLDAVGNRTKEEYKDPNGALHRNIDRTFDALNRLQTVTGAEQ